MMRLTLASRASPLISCARHEAVDIGHEGIDQHETKWLARVVRRPEQGEGRHGALDCRGVHAPASQHLLEDPPVGRVVVHDEHAQPLEARRARRLRRFGQPWRHREAGGEMELAASTDLALDPDSPAHQLDELRGDREPEAGAAVSSRRGGVGLDEGPKICHCFSAGMPMPVSETVNFNTTSSPSCRSTDRNVDDHLAVVGELDGVARRG